MTPKKTKNSSATIALNRKASHEFTLGEQFEAGVALQGWEVKSIRAGRVQLKESYVLLKRGEAWLFGAHISPLPTTSTHKPADPLRTRKLLLNKRELNQLIGAVQRKGFTTVVLSLYWKKHLVKAKIALAKGKKTHDKRATEQRKDWERQKQRLKKTTHRHT